LRSSRPSGRSGTRSATPGQPELAGWPQLLGADGAAIPFLRYLPEDLSPLGVSVEAGLRARLGEAPSFVAFEGYDTVAVLAEVMRRHGTRGRIRFSRVPGVSVWQWARPAVQVVDRDPAEPGRFRVLHTA
jgi:hypothetical protein